MTRYLAALILTIAVANAAPPPNARGDLSEWFHDLRQPGSNADCCGLPDCRAVDIRPAGDHWQAFVSSKSFIDAPDTWVDIPDAVILHRHDNPTGSAILCWYQAKPWCFIEGSGM